MKQTISLYTHLLLLFIGILCTLPLCARKDIRKYNLLLDIVSEQKKKQGILDARLAALETQKTATSTESTSVKKATDENDISGGRDGESEATTQTAPSERPTLTPGEPPADLTKKQKRLYERINVQHDPLRNTATFAEAAQKLTDIVNGALRNDPRDIIKSHEYLRTLLLAVVLVSTSVIEKVKTLSDAKARKKGLQEGVELYEEVLKQKERLGITGTPLEPYLEDVAALRDVCQEAVDPLSKEEEDFLIFLRDNACKLQEADTFYPFVKELFEKVDGSALSDSGRKMVGENPRIRRFFFSPKGILIEDVPEGLSPEGQRYGIKLFGEVLKNPNDFGWSNLPQADYIRAQLTKLREDIAQEDAPDARAVSYNTKEQAVYDATSRLARVLYGSEAGAETVTFAPSALTDLARLTREVKAVGNMIDGGFGDKKSLIRGNEQLRAAFMKVVLLPDALIAGIKELPTTPKEAGKSRAQLIAKCMELLNEVLQQKEALGITDARYLEEISARRDALDMITDSLNEAEQRLLEFLQQTLSRMQQLATEAHELFEQIKTSANPQVRVPLLNKRNDLLQEYGNLLRDLYEKLDSKGERQVIGGNPRIRRFFFSPKGILIENIPEGLTEEGQAMAIKAVQVVMDNPKELGYKDLVEYPQIKATLSKLKADAEKEEAASMRALPEEAQSLYNFVLQQAPKLQSAATFQTAAQQLFDRMNSNSERNLVGNNALLRNLVFSPRGLLVSDLPERLSAEAKSIGLKLYQALRSNPRDFGYKSDPAYPRIKRTLNALIADINAEEGDSSATRKGGGKEETKENKDDDEFGTFADDDDDDIETKKSPQNMRQQRQFMSQRKGIHGQSRMRGQRMTAQRQAWARQRGRGNYQFGQRRTQRGYQRNSQRSSAAEQQRMRLEQEKLRLERERLELERAKLRTNYYRGRGIGYNRNNADDRYRRDRRNAPYINARPQGSRGYNGIDSRRQNRRRALRGYGRQDIISNYGRQPGTQRYRKQPVYGQRMPTGYGTQQMQPPRYGGNSVYGGQTQLQRTTYDQRAYNRQTQQATYGQSRYNRAVFSQTAIRRQRNPQMQRQLALINQRLRQERNPQTRTQLNRQRNVLLQRMGYTTKRRPRSREASSYKRLQRRRQRMAWLQQRMRTETKPRKRRAYQQEYANLQRTMRSTGIQASYGTPRQEARLRWGRLRSGMQASNAFRNAGME